jgi:hypothetical protein
MNVFKLERLVQIDCNKSASIEKIVLKYDDYLSSLVFKTNSGPNEIHFTRINKYRGQALNIFRDGTISIYFKNDKLNVNWSVELDILYYFSGLTGLILGFAADILFNTSVSVSITTGLIGAALTLIFGTLSIISDINDINIACLDLPTDKL